MFLDFFYELKSKGLPVSLREYLMLMEAMDHDVANKSTEGFYYLARCALVKDESNLDRFDSAFSQFFKGAGLLQEVETREIPQEWLRKLAEKHLSPEEKAEIEALGGWDKLMETLTKRLQEQEKRHQGGSKWIGTAGTSPFGAYGYNPEGVRIGQTESRHRRAVKVWDKREFRDLDSSIELGIRNIKVALKRLRRFARTGAAEELDLDHTIKASAQTGMLDVKMRPERRNAVKVLLFFDVGGSMDDHIQTCEELFSAASTEFKVMEYFYYHNCPYESLWKHNDRRQSERLLTSDIFHKYPADYKVIFVGDASMSPYEIAYAGGSVEHWNEEPGAIWLQRFMNQYTNAVWLNPVSESEWKYTRSIQMINELMENRMYPLTLDGLDKAMKELAR